MLSKLKMPLKLKCFAWLMLSNKIITWDNLCKRGFNGLGLCVLCYQNVESVHHIMNDYAFTCNIWQHVMKHCGISFNWQGSGLNSGIRRWMCLYPAYKSMPLWICWQIRLYRNEMIFEMKSRSMDWMLSRILSNCGEGTALEKKIRIIKKPLFYASMIRGFFMVLHSGRDWIVELVVYCNSLMI